jgi:hypothetical protein
MNDHSTVSASARMTRTRRTLSATAAALALTIGASTARADPGGVPEALKQINSTLNALVATVNQLATKVTELANAIGTPPAAAAALLTPPLIASPGVLLSCNVANAGTADAQVTIMILDNSGAVSSQVSFTLPPGVAFSFTGNFTGAPRMCKFTSTTGSLAQLRASGAILGGMPLTTMAIADAR